MKYSAMRFHYTLTTWLLLQLITSGAAYNILGVFPQLLKSHYIAGASLMRSLASDGHNVTLVSPHYSESPLPNLREVRIFGVENVIDDHLQRLFWLQNMNPIQALPAFYKTGLLITNHTLTHSAMNRILTNPDEHFDVVIVEVVLTDALLGLGQHFNAPVIGFSPISTSNIASLVGTPMTMSYIPHALLSFSDEMSFGQRLDNALVTMFAGATSKFYHPYQEEIYNDVFTREDKPSYQEVLHSVSLVLINQHYSTNVPRPTMPNMIEVGGIHIDEPKQLPVDIQEFIEEAKHGVIYLSLGSHIKSTKLPQALCNEIVNALRAFKERVLWKWDAVDLTEKPANVMIKRWFPQNDVLRHPNVRLFITHGGALSLTEAVYHGLPVVGIPFFGDQSINVQRSVNQGLGLAIGYANLTTASLTWATNEVLNNPKYVQRAKEMSITFRDQPIKPMNLAKYWVEYVARYKGAPQLQSAGKRLSLMQYYSFDVYSVLLSGVVLWLYLVWIALLSLCRTCPTPNEIHTVRVCDMCLKAIGGRRK